MTICYNIDCLKIASFNYNGCMPHYCSTHKLENMINVKNKHCEELKCTIRAGFNFIYVGINHQFC